MNDLIAKRYAKAIALRADISEFYDNLSILSSVFASPKFKNIIESNQIQKEKKLEFVISLIEKASPSFNNFLKLLAENSRLSCIPQIAKELERQKSFKENIFLGTVYSKEVLSEDNIKELENRLSAKFGVKIKLQNKVGLNEGVKISLEELGYEISFSMKALQNKMSEYILKII
ncbi:TPA: F0F1 ATP synthase subunit delta [Campylobacter coli]|nr:F0F1 ATP synthase subunit delta [Campylobacter coli]HEF9492203.1 F0F1 ATP synthase subunit delta [Campylobacter coli]